jgi:hypothetical protein
MLKREHKREKEEEAKKESSDSLAAVPGAYSTENLKVSDRIYFVIHCHRYISF